MTYRWQYDVSFEFCCKWEIEHNCDNRKDKGKFAREPAKSRRQKV